MSLSRPVIWVALMALLAGIAAPLMPRAPYASYFGPLPAPVAMLLFAGLGLLAIARLERAGWARSGWPSARRLRVLAGIGAGFALPTLALDLVLPFPAGINAPLPEAFVFYPAIGYVAETLFHLLPLAVISWIAPRAFPAAAIIAALVEPTFQIALGGGLDLRNAIMAVILFGFGLAQVIALKRHGFAAAYTMRLGYYLVWHILWGAARLPLLFGQ